MNFIRAWPVHASGHCTVWEGQLQHMLQQHPVCQDPCSRNHIEYLTHTLRFSCRIWGMKMLVGSHTTQNTELAPCLVWTARQVVKSTLLITALWRNWNGITRLPSKFCALCCSWADFTRLLLYASSIAFLHLSKILSLCARL